MIASETVRWIYSLALVLAAATCVYRCCEHRSVRGWIDAAWHVVMCVGMIAMAWPFSMSWPADPQILVYGLGALWFSWSMVDGYAVRHNACGRVGAFLHTTMMLGMIWMVVAMPQAMAATGTGGHEMPGMPGHIIGGEPGPVPLSLLLPALGFGALFVVLGTRMLGRTLDLVRVPGTASVNRRLAVSFAGDATMSLGMAAMALVML